MPGRQDTMTLNSIHTGDGMKTTTVKFSTIRGNSMNLHTNDIDGAIPKLHGNKPV